jgi:hypothetical protein
MGTYSSDDIKIRHRPSDRLFYDQYRWCVTFFMRGASVLRGGMYDRDYIDHRYQQRYHNQIWMVNNWQTNYGGNWCGALDEKQRDSDVGNLSALATLLGALHDQGKSVVSGDRIWYYTNEWQSVERLASCDWIPERGSLRVTEAVVSRPRDTVVVPDSKYNLRSYFREMPLTEDAQHTLRQYLSAQSQWRLAPSLHDWVRNQPTKNTMFSLTKPQYLRPHWFIDHHTQQEVLMWNLVVPRMIRRTVAIIKVNN